MACSLGVCRKRRVRDGSSSDERMLFRFRACSRVCSMFRFNRLPPHRIRARNHVFLQNAAPTHLLGCAASASIMCAN